MVQATECDKCFAFDEPHILLVNGGVCEYCRTHPEEA